MKMSKKYFSIILLVASTLVITPNQAMNSYRERLNNMVQYISLSLPSAQDINHLVLRTKNSLIENRHITIPVLATITVGTCIYLSRRLFSRGKKTITSIIVDPVTQKTESTQTKTDQEKEYVNASQQTVLSKKKQVITVLNDSPSSLKVCISKGDSDISTEATEKTYIFMEHSHDEIVID